MLTLEIRAFRGTEDVAMRRALPFTVLASGGRRWHRLLLALRNGEGVKPESMTRRPCTNRIAGSSASAGRSNWW